MALSRWPVTLLGAAGALVAGFGGQGTPAAAGVAWAALAGLGLSLMLHGLGLRIIGLLVALLGVGGMVLAFMTTAWLAIPFAVVLSAGVLMLIVGPNWIRRKPPKQASDDWWKRMDAGDDPTE